jgi:PadR family transcriptional regulator, regulatory protein AphA
VSLPHALLGLLKVQPASGYELAKVFDRDLGRYAWQAGHTSIYPELNRLAKRGLVEVSDAGARGRRTYAITDAGKEELRTWMLTPTGNGVVRNEAVLRMFLISALDPDDARELLRRIAKHAADAATELRAVLAAAEAEHPESGAEASAEASARAGFGRLAGEYGVRQYDAVHEWALWALDQLAD